MRRSRGREPPSPGIAGELRGRGSRTTDRPPHPWPSKFRTGIAGRVYTNAELGCRMTAPGDDWSIEEVEK